LLYQTQMQNQPVDVEAVSQSKSNIPIFFAIDNFLDEADWDIALEELHNPGWYYGAWTGQTTSQWMKFLDNTKFFSTRFKETVNAKVKQYGLTSNTKLNNIRANSTGFGVGGREHKDSAVAGRENWYTLIWYANKEYHPSWGGQFYYYEEENKVKHAMPLPNQAICYSGLVAHSWLPYLNYEGQRLNVVTTLIPI